MRGDNRNVTGLYKRVTRIAGPMNQPTRDGLKSATDIFGVLVLNIAVAK